MCTRPSKTSSQATRLLTSSWGRHCRRGISPSYTEHPGVKGRADQPLPIALYMDGLPYTITDSVVGVWLQCLISKRRVLVAVVRKRLACRCGCRGWDTFDPVMRWLR
eukprot:3141743-Alexandrium_andersonii.AAC.1